MIAARQACVSSPVSGTAAASWYAVCTRPRHEKRVWQHLLDQGTEGFLPLFREEHRWKDRKKLVELPLFRGYVFVRVSYEERLSVLRTPGVVRFVSFRGQPAVLPDEQIQALRSGCGGGLKFTPHPFLKVGTRVRVRDGCLAGAEGILVRSKHSLRFVLALELLNRAVSVEVDAADVEPLQVRPGSSLRAAELRS